MADAEDEAVLLTNDKASMTKQQAINSGYYQDPYLPLFLTAKSKRHYQRQTPEIIRGYFLRSCSIAYCVEQFLLANSKGCQLISLGAGWDSLYWRLCSVGSLTESMKNTNYIEIDMPQVTRHKSNIVNRSAELSKVLTNIKCQGENLHSDGYHILSHDLRQRDRSKLMVKLVETCGLDLSKPTLCVSECVLVFLPIESSVSLISWFGSNFADLSFLLYEQCNMVDKFADIMVASMHERQCDLLGIEACQSLESQAQRFISAGMNYTKAWTMDEICHRKISPEVLVHIEGLEFLDEKELLDQLLLHYCVILASNQPLAWFSDAAIWSSSSTRHSNKA